MRPLLTVTLMAGVLALAACGSESRVQVRAAAKLPRDVATSLAARSDALAAALRRRDACAARTQVHGLEQQTQMAITSGRVPEAYDARLLAAVKQLAVRMPTCVPPAPPPPPKPEKKKQQEKQDRGKHHGGEGRD